MGVTYNGKQFDIARIIAKNIITASYEPVTYKTSKELKSNWIRTEVTPYEMTITYQINNTNRDEVKKRIFQICNMLYGAFEFDNDCFKYEVTLSEQVEQKYISPYEVLLTMKYNCEITSKVTTSITIPSTMDVVIEGARETYLNFTVVGTGTAKINDMTVRVNNETVIIDSEKRLADLTKVDLISFPSGFGLYPLVIEKPDAITITMSYTARW